jgi:hypothetical protein
LSTAGLLKADSAAAKGLPTDADAAMLLEAALAA